MVSPMKDTPLDLTKLHQSKRKGAPKAVDDDTDRSELNSIH